MKIVERWESYDADNNEQLPNMCAKLLECSHRRCTVGKLVEKEGEGLLRKEKRREEKNRWQKIPVTYLRAYQRIPLHQYSHHHSKHGNYCLSSSPLGQPGQVPEPPNPEFCYFTTCNIFETRICFKLSTI